MKSNKIEDYLSENKIKIDNYIKKLLSEYRASSDILGEAIEYTVFSGGKRLRPILCIAACDAVGGCDEYSLPAACSIEFIHNYSLIHDDLPCMDNDDYRRGKPTCHKKFDEATALLAGDGLLTLAFEILSKEYLSFPPSSSHTVLKVIAEIACAAGISGMVGGQSIDLKHTQKDLKSLEELHKMKTGALIRASVRAGAILGNASRHNVECLTGYAEKLGFAFQIVDDILDGYKDNQENNFLTFYNSDDAWLKVKELTESALDYIDDLGDKGYYLRQIAWYLSKRSY